MGLAIYAVMCCGIIVCLALGLYELMQPRRFANPGLAAYKPLPGAVVNLVDLGAPAPPPELITASIEPPAQTFDISTSPQRQPSQRRHMRNRNVRSASARGVCDNGP